MINNKKTFGLILLIFTLTISFLILIFQRGINKQNLVQSPPLSPIDQSSLTPTPKEKPINLPQTYKGEVILEKENSLAVNLNQNFSLILKADIPHEDIVGFDVVLSYDNQMLEFVSATSLVDGFTLIPVMKESYLRLTVAKSPSFNQPALFSQTPLIRLTFKPVKKGITLVEVSSKVGKDKTQFVNSKMEIIYPTSSKIEVNVL